MATDRPMPAMFPLMLDVTAIPIFIIGGEGARGRLDALVDYGATAIHVFSGNGAAAFANVTSGHVQTRWPEARDFEGVRPRLVFIDGVDDSQAAAWRDQAHAVGALVHVQDRIPLCDFHMPAILRRGHLQVAVSTDGIAPGLARVVRDHIGERVLTRVWAERVNEVARARAQWKREGLPLAELGKAILGFIKDRKWLDS